MKQVFRLFLNSYRLFWNDKVSVLLTFIVPLVLMTIFGSIFGGSGSGPNGIRLAVLNQSSAPVAKSIESSLDTMKSFQIIKSFKNDSGKVIIFDTLSIQDYVRTGNTSAALVLPPDAYADTSMGLYVKFYYDPKNDIEMQTTQGLIQQVVFSQFPSIIAQSGLRQSEQFLGMQSGGTFNRSMASLIHKYFGVDTNLVLHPKLSNMKITNSDSTKSSFDFFKNVVRIENQQLVGKEVTNPWATRSVGGWAMTFLLFTLTASSSSLFEDRKSGVLLRLLTSPVSRVHILWSKYLFNMSLGIIQLLFMFLSGWFMFQIDIFSNFFNLMLIIIAASTACCIFTNTPTGSGLRHSIYSKYECNWRSVVPDQLYAGNYSIL